MTTKVLLRDRPNRALALVGPTHALVFKHSGGTAAGYGQGYNGSSSTSLTNNTGLGDTVGNTSSGGNNVTGAAGKQKCIVELVESDSQILRDYRTIVSGVHGTLGLITVDNEVFLCVVSGAAKAAVARPGETVQKILAVDFLCLNSSEYDHAHDHLPYVSPDILDDDAVLEADPRKDPTSFEHPCLNISKLLSGGSFYFSTDFDLTSRLQERCTDAAVFDFDNFDRSYLWNSYMIQPLVDFRSRLSSQERKWLDSARLLTSAIRGFAYTKNISAPVAPARVNKSGFPSTLTLISRLSCRRAGTRFNARGIDDEGQVANFVETETIYWSPSGVCFSYVQVRGSIPVFWEQAAGLLPGQQKIQITRSPQATQPAFDKHFEELELKYGPIHVVNLLSKEKSGEIELSHRFHQHILHSSLNSRESSDAMSEHKFISETNYDFHAETRGPVGYEAAGSIRGYLLNSAESFMCCVLDDTSEKALELTNDDPLKHSTQVLQQTGVFRTNCLDCLDRTNLVQTIISQLALEIWLDPRGEGLSSDFKVHHGTLWADNGDALSHIYAGTGALKSSFTRHGKMSLAGALSDVRKSAQRAYINNFADKGRQTTIDMLLGRLIGQVPVYLFDPINDFVVAELSKRSGEYSSTKDITIWAGTFNLNGRAEGLNADLSPWLCPPVAPAHQQPLIVAVAFQEIVELSPQQIMSTEPTRRQAWEKAVKQALNENAKMQGVDKYVLLRGGQLVGASLSIFVKSRFLPHIKDVEGSLKKTGLSGVAGNKGAVAIRMDIDNTSLCFVTAHLAAGFANYDERNRDYKTISQGLRFQRNRSIDDHDTVIWLGDFNYRIGLSSERAKSFIRVGDLEQLYLNDQLNLQMVKGLVFPYYSEARITFMPTYKYDVGTDTYDTSEKARIPAWTDRILRKGNNLRQIDYSTAPLKFSDHRPVYATFECTINVVNQKLRDQMSRDIYSSRRAAIESGLSDKISRRSEDSDEDDLLGYEAIEPSLPPASSDRRKWWLDNGMPARAEVQPPGEGYIVNADRPFNPFVPTDQPDWRSPPQLPPRKPVIPHSSNSTTSSSAGLDRKPSAPPIPRKPLGLTNTANGSPRGSPDAAVMAPPPPPRRPTANLTSDTGQVHDEIMPSKQPRPQETSQGIGSAGLMDKAHDGADPLAAWEPLKPS